MLKSSFLRLALCMGVALGATTAARAADDAATLKAQLLKMPPMSSRTARYFSTHQAAYDAFINRLATQSTAAAGSRTTTTAGGTWEAVKTGNIGGYCNPLLLTDGSVLVASCDTKIWWKLTPNLDGSYTKGKWTRLADLPVIGGTQYAPLYHSAGVLPDGRVLIMGGEYNGPKAVWTNLGAIYDPVANTWTPVNAPLGSQWTQIGDAQSVMLDNGAFLLGACCTYHPTADALFNAKTLSWTEVPGPRYGGEYQDEQGYELLPNGDVLTLDIWTGYILGTGPSRNTELYVPSRRNWVQGPMTPVSLPDQVACGTFEIGPAPLRTTLSVVAFGANTGCNSGESPVDPTAILDLQSRTWTQGPDVPSLCGNNGKTACDLADAPAAVMPDGNILFAASSGYGDAPTHFFEFGADNTITQVSDPLANSTQQGAYTYFFLDLPNGQILMTDFSNEMEVYTPSGTTISTNAPKITSAPTSVHAGGTYTIEGQQLGGRTAGAYYGDDAQMATNFPVVRFTSTTTHHVFYARTTHISTMSVAPNAAGSARITVPAGIESGYALMEVIANGVASKPSVVTVQ